jgi:hypothetical protein
MAIRIGRIRVQRLDQIGRHCTRATRDAGDVYYVRQPDTVRFPISGARRERVPRQLDYVATLLAGVDRGVISPRERTGEAAASTISLTFDVTAISELPGGVSTASGASIARAFFPVTMSLIGRRVLDVNRIQFVLARPALGCSGARD